MKHPEKGQLLRIFIDEGDNFKGKKLYEAIVYKARELNIAGATVLKGIMGYGSESRIHTAKILRLSESLPIVIEIVDSKENIEKLLPYLDEMVNVGMITRENVEVIKYRHGD